MLTVLAIVLGCNVLNGNFARAIGEITQKK